MSYCRQLTCADYPSYPKPEASLPRQKIHSGRAAARYNLYRVDRRLRPRVRPSRARRAFRAVPPRARGSSRACPPGRGAPKSRRVLRVIEELTVRDNEFRLRFIAFKLYTVSSKSLMQPVVLLKYHTVTERERRGGKSQIPKLSLCCCTSSREEAPLP